MEHKYEGKPYNPPKSAKSKHTSRNKLQPNQVLSIVEEYGSGSINMTDLGKKYNVSQVTISLILNGTAWSKTTGIVHTGRKRKNLTEKQHMEIFVKHEVENIRPYDLAKEYNRNLSTIQKIVYNKKRREDYNNLVKSMKHAV